MGHRNPHLRPDQSSGQRRVDVADDEDQIGMVAGEGQSQPSHDLGSLDCGGAGPHVQIDLRGGGLQVLEEKTSHAVVVVLPVWGSAHASSGYWRVALRGWATLTEM